MEEARQTKVQILDETTANQIAAGEVIGMYHGPYVGSTSVLRGAVFGRLAGRHAARRPAAARA